MDTHTATEAKGRFARLCIQVDVKKPLITAIVIGKFEQPVSYEGIQKLCFDCGRIGHRRESCPYTIRRNSLSKEMRMEVVGANGDHSCETYATDKPKAKVGPNVAMQEDVHDVAHDSGENVSDSTYGPWAVMTRKNNGTKSQRSGGSSTIQEKMHALEKHVLEGKDTKGPSRAGFKNGLLRQTKRKLSSMRIVEKEHVASAIQKIGEGHNSQTQTHIVQCTNSRDKVASEYRAKQGFVLAKPNRANQRVSVKGKKVITRLRASQSDNTSAVDEGQCSFHSLFTIRDSHSHTPSGLIIQPWRTEPKSSY